MNTLPHPVLLLRKASKVIGVVIFLVLCAWAGHRAALALLAEELARKRPQFVAGERIVLTGGEDPVLVSAEQRVLRSAVFAQENGISIEKWLQNGSVTALPAGEEGEVLEDDGAFLRLRCPNRPDSVWVPSNRASRGQ
jgi:hypothetical protein